MNATSTSTGTTLNGLKIAGYGGAAVWTTGIPQKYVVKYNVGIGVADMRNEMYKFFKAIRPDIVVAHQPTHGVHDRLTFVGPSGSPPLRTFCENTHVRYCLTGHIHNDWGFKHIENTVYLNPSNFGEVTTVKGEGPLTAICLQTLEVELRVDFSDINALVAIRRTSRIAPKLLQDL